MKIKITPLRKFDKDVGALIDNRELLKDDYEDFKKTLAENPELGPTIAKTGGVRKIRLKSAAKKMSRLFDDLKDGLNEMIAHKKGKITLRSEIIEVPEPPIVYKPSHIKKIRKKVITLKVYLQKF